jgi:hypothetical protein
MAKKIVFLVILIYNVNSLRAFDNRIYFDFGMGMNFSDPIVYTQLPYINFEWNGIFSNKLGLILGINYERLSGQVRYFPDRNIPTNRYENINFFKYSFGQAWGQNFKIYVKENIIQLNNVFGFSLSTGHRGSWFFGESDFGLGYFINFDFPMTLFNEEGSVYPSDASFSIGISFMYSIGRKKSIERKKQLQMEQIEEERIRKIEEERLAHERMLQERGLTEEQWQGQEAEKRRQEEIRRQEQTALSKLIQNLIDVGFNVGDPFRVGEIVSIPYGLFTAIDFSRQNDLNSYLVIMNDYTTPTKPFYIETIRQLNSIGPMRIQYVGTAQYLDGRVPRNTLVFREIR